MTSPFVPLTQYREYPVPEMQLRAREFADDLHRRRTVRQFSDRPVPRAIIEDCLRAAGSAPSGAHRQPWYFVAVSDQETKRAIRVEAEKAEQRFYREAPREWLEALAPLGTDDQKPYLEIAPWLIAVFAERYQMCATGERSPNYYVMESVGIATGMLIAALHHAGLVTLTHTPSPMGFLNHLLDRPATEKPFLLLVAGYPAPDARVPNLVRKDLPEFVTFR